jgi:hypothetical protein
MSAFLAVTRRELAEKRFVLLAAAAAGLFPLGLPLVAHLPGASAGEARGFAAVILAATVAGGLSIALGSSVLAGEIASRRIGFFFSRPVSAAALWVGKLSAAMLLVIASVAIVLVPSMTVNRNLAPLNDLFSTGPVAACAIALGFFLLLLLLSNAAGIATRSRSPRLAADVLVLALVALAFWSMGARLRRFAMAPGSVLALIVGVLAPLLLVALLIAAHRATASGRTDVRAAHRALSATLWVVLGISTLACEAYSVWALAAPPASLKDLGASCLGTQGWITLSGRARGLEASYLYDTRTGRFQRIPNDSWQTAVSENEKTAAWLEASAPQGPWTVKTLRLDDASARPVETRVTFSRQPSSLVLSPEGDKIAALDREVLSVTELATARSLGSARVIDWRDSATVFFPSPDVVRVLRRKAGPQGTVDVQLEILEFRTASKTVTVMGTSEMLRGPLLVQMGAGGERIVVREKTGSRITLRDGRTAERLATLRESPSLVFSWPFFLSDGRPGLALTIGQSATVEIYSAAGAKEKTIALPQRGSLRPGGEVAPGRLAVVLTSVEPAPVGSLATTERTLYLVDVDGGTATRVANGLVPVLVPWWTRPSSIPPGTEATRLFFSSEKGGLALVRFDPSTGERRVLLGQK